MDKLLCIVNGNPAKRMIVLHEPGGTFHLQHSLAVKKGLSHNIFHDLSEIEDTLGVTLEVLEEV